MNIFQEKNTIEKRDINFVAFEGLMMLGYEVTSDKAVYINDFFESDLLSEMNNDYIKWVEPLLGLLKIKVELVETETDIYEKLVREYD